MAASKWRAQRAANLHDINVDTPWIHHHYRDRQVTLRMEKQRYFSENHTQNLRGSNPGRIHDWRGSESLYELATPLH